MPGATIDRWIDDLRAGDVVLHARRPDRRDPHAASLRFRDPVRVHRLPAGGDVEPFLQRLDEELQAGFALAGYLTYEAGYALVGVSGAPEPPHAAAWFGAYDPRRVGRIDHPGRPLPLADPHPSVPSARTTGLRWAWTPERWREAVGRVHEALRSGDSYQANLTTRATMPVADARALYRAVSASQPTAYGALLDDGEIRLVSVSPELFLRVDPGPSGLGVTTRPMKGTAPRGADVGADDRAAAWLRADPKSRAENVMITDLLRNDLGRVARSGGVRVPALFEVERFRSVLQLTSTVEADLAPDVGLADLLRATFPCGSITGAPKRRTMELLRDLEDAPRGAYTGAIGYALPAGDGCDGTGLGSAVFSVAIRTVTVQDGVGTLGVGGGIVIDSDPEAEHREVHAKAGFLSDPAPPLFLIETMRAEGRTVLRWERHLARATRSAAYHQVPLDPDRLAREVADALAATPGASTPGAVHRVRLTIDEAGDPTVTVAPHRDPDPDADPDAAVARVAWAVPRVSAGLARQRHKTSDRELYDRATAWARATGTDEVLFRERSGRIAEGAISTVFVRRPGEGRLLTPPVADGALPGVLRAELLERGQATERSLTPSDLDGAELWIGNALRGMRRAVLGDARFDPADGA